MVSIPIQRRCNSSGLTISIFFEREKESAHKIFIRQERQNLTYDIFG
jgi:hypothetical protein